MIHIRYYYPEDFSSLQDCWLRLQHGKDMTAFQSYAWYQLINRQYLAKAKPLPGKAIYAVASIDDQDCMIAPLHIFKVPFLSKIHLPAGAYILGKWGYTDYLNFIYSDFSAECFEAIIADVKTKFGVPVCFLHQILPQAEIRTYIEATYPNALTMEGSCAAIEPRESFEAYKMSLSKNTRQNIRTAENRAAKDGIQIRCAVLDSMSEQDADAFFAIYARRQEEKNANLSGAAARALYRLRRARSCRQMKRFNFLKSCLCGCEGVKTVGFFSGEQKIGFCLVLEDVAAYRVPVICFRHEFARYSPGIVCILRFLEERYTDGSIRTFDLLKGTENYKLSLGADVFSIGYYTV